MNAKILGALFQSTSRLEIVQSLNLVMTNTYLLLLLFKNNKTDKNYFPASTYAVAVL